MELKEFIVKTVEEIIDAVAKIQANRTHYMGLKTEKGKPVYPIKSGEETFIEFDIAVTLEE